MGPQSTSSCRDPAQVMGLGRRGGEGTVWPLSTYLRDRAAWEGDVMSPDVPLAGSYPCCAPSPGLLAGLWEFPSLPLAQGLQEEKQREALADHLRAWTGWPVAAGGLRFIGEVSLRRGMQRDPLCLATGDVAGREEGPPSLLPPLPSPAQLCRALADSVHL